MLFYRQTLSVALFLHSPSFKAFLVALHALLQCKHAHQWYTHVLSALALLTYTPLHASCQPALSGLLQMGTIPRPPHFMHCMVLVYLGCGHDLTQSNYVLSLFDTRVKGKYGKHQPTFYVSQKRMKQMFLSKHGPLLFIFEKSKKAFSEAGVACEFKGALNTVLSHKAIKCWQKAQQPINEE